MYHMVDFIFIFLYVYITVVFFLLSELTKELESKTANGSQADQVCTCVIYGVLIIEFLSISVCCHP